MKIKQRTTDELVHINKGIYKLNYGDVWAAQIWINGKAKSLATFDSIENAIAARIEAANKLHGEFANSRSYV